MKVHPRSYWRNLDRTSYRLLMYPSSKHEDSCNMEDMLRLEILQSLLLSI